MDFLSPSKAQDVGIVEWGHKAKAFRWVGGTAHALQISAGDLLDVEVFDTTELSGKLRVDERGSIALPIAGDLVVSGLTAEQAGHTIEQKLLTTNILKDPHVSVTVLEYARHKVLRVLMAK